jgi:hypothetical protein
LQCNSLMKEDDSLLYMKTDWPVGRVIHEVKDINVRHGWYLSDTGGTKRNSCFDPSPNHPIND